MIQTLILLLFQVISIYVTIKTMKTLNQSQLYQNIPLELSQMILLLGIYMPLVEEIVFRYALKTYLSSFPYSDIINAVLFGLVHIVNYLIHKNRYIAVYHVISITYLGYYLIQFDSFLYTFLIHAYYNLTISGVSYYLYWVLYVKTQSDNQTDYDDVIVCQVRHMDDELIGHPKGLILRSKRIPKNKLSPDMLDRIAKYDQISLKRLEKALLSQRRKHKIAP